MKSEIQSPFLEYTTEMYPEQSHLSLNNMTHVLRAQVLDYLHHILSQNAQHSY